MKIYDNRTAIPLDEHRSNVEAELLDLQRKLVALDAMEKVFPDVVSVIEEDDGTEYDLFYGSELVRTNPNVELDFDYGDVNCGKSWHLLEAMPFVKVPYVFQGEQTFIKVYDPLFKFRVFIKNWTKMSVQHKYGESFSWDKID